ARGGRARGTIALIGSILIGTARRGGNKAERAVVLRNAAGASCRLWAGVWRAGRAVGLVCTAGRNAARAGADGTAAGIKAAGAEGRTGVGGTGGPVAPVPSV